MEIKNLLHSQKSNALISSLSEKVDTNTGEVVSQEKITVRKFKKPDEFIKVFVDNLEFINKELTMIGKSILFGVLQEVRWNNVLRIDAGFKQDIMETVNLGRTSVYKGINELIKKNVLIAINTEELKREFSVKNDRSYFLNPNIMGKGNLRDIHKIRQTTSLDFDFAKKEYSKRIVRTTFREGYEELLANPNNYEISHIDYKENNTEKEIDITVNDKVPSPEVQNVLELKPNLVENKDLDAKKAEILQMLKATPAQPLDEEGQKIMAMAGKWSGFFDPTKSVKEMKMQAIKEDIERIDRQNEQ